MDGLQCANNKFRVEIFIKNELLSTHALFSPKLCDSTEVMFYANSVGSHWDSLVLLHVCLICCLLTATLYNHVRFARKHQPYEYLLAQTKPRTLPAMKKTHQAKFSPLIYSYNEHTRLLVNFIASLS